MNGQKDDDTFSVQINADWTILFTFTGLKNSVLVDCSVWIMLKKGQMKGYWGCKKKTSFKTNCQAENMINNLLKVWTFLVMSAMLNVRTPMIITNPFFIYNFVCPLATPSLWLPFVFYHSCNLIFLRSRKFHLWLMSNGKYYIHNIVIWYEYGHWYQVHKDA